MCSSPATATRCSISCCPSDASRFFARRKPTNARSRAKHPPERVSPTPGVNGPRISPAGAVFFSYNEFNRLNVAHTTRTLVDDYPSHLEPDFEEGGAVATPFPEWWSRVHSNFPTVPEEVARYWLHEHCGHSPFSHLRSKEYQFEEAIWQSSELQRISSGWCNFDKVNVVCKKHGEHLASLSGPPHLYPTAVYMKKHGRFPTPIVVLDNRDGHLKTNSELGGLLPLPSCFVLIEGHRRFNLALHLHEIGELKPHLKVWLMTRKETGLCLSTCRHPT